MAEIFHRVTFAGVGLNALAVPVMTLLLALALAINLLAVLSPTLAAWPAKLLSLRHDGALQHDAPAGLAICGSPLSVFLPRPFTLLADSARRSSCRSTCQLRPPMDGFGPRRLRCFVGLVRGAPFSPRLPVGGPCKSQRSIADRATPLILFSPMGLRFLSMRGHARSRPRLAFGAALESG